MDENASLQTPTLAKKRILCHNTYAIERTFDFSSHPELILGFLFILSVFEVWRKIMS